MKEKILKRKSNGFLLLLVNLLATIFSSGMIIYLATKEKYVLMILFVFISILSLINYAGFKMVGPQEAIVLTLFGKYIGSIKSNGFYYVNPFVVSVNPAAKTKLGQSADVDKESKNSNPNVQQVNKKISLKVMTLSNSRQKVNDVLGNPVEIGIAVMWKVVDTASAVFNVDNYKEYLSLQCDAALRDIVRIYPYDVAQNVDTTGDGVPDDGSLRGSSRVVAKRIKEEIQNRVEFAGLEIIDARITYLAYAPEIAQAMLRRQQASATVDARTMIVDGAVDMVKMALDKLSTEDIVDLDEERKAAMVSNLLVVLCSNNEVSPVVNSGSLY
ncbi:SPFH domain-containing protein [Peptoniphilus lacrimalis]|uniref:SPFH/Band 7/PHB domain protein n=1 Tax=Peptoniphilus lacrimalis 315-B TaxID=596330 RepID=D1VU72_9FIRM|nr:SPFH domain-containing protein [Peptoniphilus lacrimalis]EFA89931.1 SPFH/Band 7/PHB domain protein [Peptoniphilus lacrimalis 315-B]